MTSFSFTVSSSFCLIFIQISFKVLHSSKSLKKSCSSYIKLFLGALAESFLSCLSSHQDFMYLFSFILFALLSLFKLSLTIILNHSLYSFIPSLSSFEGNILLFFFPSIEINDTFKFETISKNLESQFSSKTGKSNNSKLTPLLLYISKGNFINFFLNLICKSSIHFKAILS